MKPPKVYFNPAKDHAANASDMLAEKSSVIRLIFPPKRENGRMTLRYATYAITDPRVARQILKDNERIVRGGENHRNQRRVLKRQQNKKQRQPQALEYLFYSVGMPLTSNDPRIRRAVAKHFTPKFVEKNLKSTVASIVETLLTDLENALANDGKADFKKIVSHELPVRVTCALIGIDHETDATTLGPLVNRVFNGDNEAIIEMAQFVGAIIENQVKNGLKGGSLLEKIVSDCFDAKIPADRKLHEAELVPTILQLIVAGFDTTMAAANAAVILLTKHEEWLHRAIAGEVSWSLILKEVLRYTPPAAVLGVMYSTQDYPIDGWVIPKGAPIIMAHEAMHKNPTAYVEPKEFNPLREDTESLVFGAGRHFCLGVYLAQEELLQLLQALYTKFPELRATEIGDHVRSPMAHVHEYLLVARQAASTS